MNILRLLVVLSLTISAFATQSQKFTCNQQLMESYDLDGQSEPVKDQNLMCPEVTHNCCSYATQINIFKKWIVSGEEKTINSIYEQFAEIFDTVFEDFAQIEQLAKLVEEETEGIQNSNCHKIASTITRYKVSSLKNQIHDIVHKAREFLKTSREGFYCTLCEAKNHQYFNLTTFEYTMDFNFCSKMVENTLNYYLFKYKFFVKISRLYSEFLTKCDLSGKYFSRNFLKNDVKFFKRDEIVGEIESCKRGYDSPGSMGQCEEFCSRFNPVKFDTYLEGELDKLFILHGFFQKRIQWLKDRHLRQVALEKESAQKIHRRILEEHSVKEALNYEEPNEITKFNKEFRTTLVRPIPYHFQDDLSIKYQVHFDESVIKASQEVVYNLVEFEGAIAALGIDFYQDGQLSSIDRPTAERVFELLNPDLKEGQDLESYLKK